MRIASAVLALLLASCASVPERPYPGNLLATPASSAQNYLISPGDHLEIRFPAYPNWNTQVLVRPDGATTAPMVGHILVGGRSLEQVRSLLHSALVERIKLPDVEVDLAQMHARTVYVGGEVDQPGEVGFGGPHLTLLQAITSAGGPLKESAELRTVVLAREMPSGETRVWTVDVHSALRAPSHAPVTLCEGDVVIVPNTRIDQANLFVKNYITDLIPGSSLLTNFILTTRL